VPTSIRITGGLVLAAACLTPAACDGPPPKPPVFNDRIAQNNAKLNGAVLEFKKVIDPQVSGTPVSPAAAEQAYGALAKELKAVTRASYHMPVPVYSDKGAAYLAKYHDYLGVQNEIMDGEVRKIVDVIGDNTLDNNTKANQVWALYGKVVEHEKPSRDALFAAQQEFAKFHNLSITSSPPPK
jgi:hypothetical protein